ncbi:MAG TPA: 1-deoxy-D-xylulose-5-phosphate synthase [Syntrophorhabdaceae bacterium]|nr:1-deoxy-D-xylulose-5-phosphate synthase [Syntrophorhabdaceae bacterium]HOT41546.1 1-deoxy-D-xylulose-5-phosphate synthase [Syntrophorhabdaceae bacterium]HPC65844.1 1-deoxy-D-xylulose-5-phosphate synthase [Syntrophorhabdaceae bacterium]HQK46171.1 1-deoxy-D-xylulose-5-phosphate synthase [Syntrophorhabdaceae bacterium]HRR70696.1 1-deoxy-D-xylulose-5-phosphate synthase [Syntrophorhabdaceae bacterium]
MYLEKINLPQDLKGLTVPELNILSDEIRHLIIDVVSKTGGHLSSSLGVVELTIALHYVFNTPKDKIIWDVGHQCYAHKILTGRRDMFHTLRQDNGISGFPSRQESEYDVFNTGHASNSISIAVGLAEAKKKKAEDYRILSVIGDGSLTGGMAFEALNHAGHLKSDIIVILNDNEMSISKNIGALSSYLNRIMTGEFVTKTREEIKSMLKNLPALGDKVYKAAKHIEESIKGFITPGIFFEELGFQYFGPIDGHNLIYLIDTLKNIKRMKGPILVHVVTKKGKGYTHAEDDPSRFHGVSTFEIDTGNSKKTGLNTYTDIFGETIIELASLDERIIAITAAMGLGTGLDRFSRVFPERFYDIGIAEQHGVTFAAALALGGMKPFVAIYSTFLQRAYDQIIIDVCLQGLPVVFAVDRGGIVGQDGPTHHGVFDLSYFRHIPNIIVMSPKDENEFRHMLYSAYRYDRPVAVRYPRGDAQGVVLERELREIPIGTWEILRNGGDLTIVASGNTVYPCLAAAQILHENHIDCTVVNGRFIKPMDRELLIDVANRTKKILTVEENTVIGGFGSGILEVLSEEGIVVPVKRIGIPDMFITHGTQKTLRKRIGIDTEGIVRKVLEWLKRE